MSYTIPQFGIKDKVIIKLTKCKFKQMVDDRTIIKADNDWLNELNFHVNRMMKLKQGRVVVVCWSN